MESPLSPNKKYGFTHRLSAVGQLANVLGLEKASEDFKSLMGYLRKLTKKNLDINRTPLEQENCISSAVRKLTKKYNNYLGNQMPDHEKKLHFVRQAICQFHYAMRHSGRRRDIIEKRPSSDRRRRERSRRVSRGPSLPPQRIKKVNESKPAEKAWDDLQNGKNNSKPEISGGSPKSPTTTSPLLAQLFVSPLQTMHKPQTGLDLRQKKALKFKPSLSEQYSRNTGASVSTTLPSFSIIGPSSTAPPGSVISPASSSTIAASLNTNAVSSSNITATSSIPSSPITIPPPHPVIGRTGLAAVHYFLSTCEPDMTKHYDFFVNFGCINEQHLFACACMDKQRKYNTLKAMLPDATEMEIMFIEHHLKKHFSL